VDGLNGLGFTERIVNLATPGTLPGQDSSTLTRVHMSEVANILFPNDSVVRMVTTDFD